MDIERRLKVEELIARYVAHIDDDRLEEWPECFIDDCHYLLTSFENYSEGLPHGAIYATSKGMLRDRVKSLRDANIYEQQRYRHVVGPIRVMGEKDGEIEVRSNFIVIRIMHTGDTDLFITGEYLDKIVVSDGTYLFKERIVVTDSQKYDTLLALPI